MAFRKGSQALGISLADGEGRGCCPQGAGSFPASRRGTALPAFRLRAFPRDLYVMSFGAQLCHLFSDFSPRVWSLAEGERSGVEPHPPLVVVEERG